MLDWLTAPWSEPVLVRAFAEVGLIGVVGGMLGCWLVLYELSYSTESLAHALFPGLVAASLLGLPLLAGGAAGVLVGAAGVARTSSWPSCSRAMRVAISSASRTSCVTKIAVLPISRRSARNWRCSSTRVTGSSAPNGSSNSRSGGSAASARATPTRWRWPPDSSRG